MVCMQQKVVCRHASAVQGTNSVKGVYADVELSFVTTAHIHANVHIQCKHTDTNLNGRGILRPECNLQD